MLLLIDANSLIHRCYHALPPLTNKAGEPIGALYGVASILLKIADQLKPDHWAALFDRPEITFRKQKFAEYKIHRKKADDDLVAQLIRARDLFGAFSIKTYELAGYEADDLIGTFAKKFFRQDRVRILTGDLDTLQIVEDKKPSVHMGIEVETFRKGIGDTIVYDEDEVRKRYSLEPNQLIDYKALVGDASDNIPGVQGVGPKTAVAILQKYETLDAFFKKGEKEKAFEKISNNKNIALLSRELATIDCAVPIEASLKELAYSFSPKKALVFFEENGFESLIKRLTHPTNAPATLEKTKGVEKQSDETQTDNDTETQLALQLLELDPKKATSHLSIEKELKKRGLWRVWEAIERPLIPVIQEMKKTGIRVDKKRLKATEKKLDGEIKKKEEKLTETFGSINFNSPKQVLEVLNKKFGLKLKSTSADSLAKIQNPSHAIHALLAYRELFKLKTTYLGPLQYLVQKDGRIHPTFVQIGAATGRIACQNPNLQNIPQESEWSGEIRDAFISKEGYSLVSCDYSQIELRVLAHLTQDQDMMDAFLDKKDIHTRTAAFIFNVPDEKVDKSMRRMAKTLNFGMIYGMGYRAFAQSAGIANDEAKKFIQKYFEEFSTVKKWHETVLREARKRGYVQNESGRIRHLPGLYAANKFFASEAERAAINMPTQGLAADILKLAMIKIHTLLEKEHKGAASMILTIHDELIFEIRNSLLDGGSQSDIVQGIKKTMESVHELSVPLLVSTSIGKTWREIG